MLEDPALTVDQRAMWAERLADVEVVLADVEANPIGYMAWMLGENHSALRKQSSRFPQ